MTTNNDGTVSITLPVACDIFSICGMNITSSHPNFFLGGYVVNASTVFLGIRHYDGATDGSVGNLWLVMGKA